MYATMLFPIGAVAMAMFSYFHPEVLEGSRRLIEPLLGVVMLGMGMTLRAENFAEILRRPRLIALGCAMQFLMMPAFGYMVGRALGLSGELLVGIVLLGACPGGTASNVICYLARADVALGITLTTTTTLLSVFMTPLLTWAYLGQQMDVPVMNMMLGIVLIILVPVAAGVALNRRFSDWLHPVKRFFPYVSVLAIIFIIGIIVAVARPHFPALAPPVIAAVFWHNVLGLAGGYWAARWLGMDERVCRTFSIETGMQNSGLAVALAQNYFSVLAALPGALFSIWHNISGSVLAWHWGRKTEEEAQQRLGINSESSE
ncbi:MAG: bile acid:sodium symporter [Gammaproteobacteria bacterium RIFCSPLOWO2_02_FULL_61_13]|nr:MAG: bile acid:sodium symporter [Gammaproteobacteria bacterium RIFCSPLOWO2_02_FULL_61_13]